MRYLKINAQDVLDDDAPDTIYLDFYDDSSSPHTRLKRAVAFDITEDGKLDWVIADDMNGDGVIDRKDDNLAIELAQMFLLFNWYSVDAPFDKYLKISAEDFDADGNPDTVRMHFHQGEGDPRDETIAYGASFYTNGDGTGEGEAINFDVNNNNKVDREDSDLVKAFARCFLKFGWFGK